MEPTVFTTRAAELAAVRARRAELRGSLDLLERVLAAPAAGRAVIWGEAVHTALKPVADDFGAHVQVTEGPAGLHEAILDGDLRLANAVEGLRGEHREIAELIAELVSDTEAPVTPGDVETVRERGTLLLSRLARHRQRGADLIYEAYQTDIGGGD